MTAFQRWTTVLICHVIIIAGTPITENLVKNETENSDISLNYFVKCSRTEGVNGLVSCAAEKALKMIQQAARTETFELLPGVVLASEHLPAEREGKATVEEPLPSDPQHKADRLLELVLDAAERFFSGRTLKVKIPEMRTGIGRALEEARAKKKKGGMSNLIYLLGAKVVLLKGLALAVLGFMSLKALVIGKIAFVLAVVLGVQSLLGGNFNLKNIGGSPYSNGWIAGGTSSAGIVPSYGPPNSPGFTTNQIGGWNSQYPYARSIGGAEDEENNSRNTAHDLAYSNQKP